MNRFQEIQPAYVAWRARTITLFLLGPSSHRMLKIQTQNTLKIWSVLLASIHIQTKKTYLGTQIVKKTIL